MNSDFTAQDGQGGRERELLRQKLLLGSLVLDRAPSALRGWLKTPPARPQPDRDPAHRAWQVYRANAHAGAARALATAFPTVRALMGEASFEAMARAYWHAHPPARGDLSWLGEGLPDFIIAAEHLASEPYLADCARLDWALHRCEAAADADPAGLSSLSALAEVPPDGLRLWLAPGARLIRSAHPIVAIWRAHQAPSDGAIDPFAPVREAFASGRGECAWVRREGWRACVEAIDEPTAAFIAALSPLAGSPDAGNLAQALDAAGPGWRFDAWLVDAVRHGFVSHLERLA